MCWTEKIACPLEITGLAYKVKVFFSSKIQVGRCSASQIDNRGGGLKRRVQQT